MALISVLRNNVRVSAVPRYERLVRYIAAQARESDDAYPWSVRVSTGSEGRAISFVTAAEGFAELSARKDPDELVRALLGEGDGNAVLEALGEGVESSSYIVANVREDLSSQALQQEAQAPLAVVTRLRSAPGGAQATEELIRRVVEGAAKVDDKRRYLVLQTTIGEVGTFAAVQGVEDPAQLDSQQTLPELLTEAYGEKEAGKILSEGTTCLAEVQAELSVLRPELSNPA
jgi:hypothetical protein